VFACASVHAQEKFESKPSWLRAPFSSYHAILQLSAALGPLSDIRVGRS
jgi:hypothetical protein